jgi:hypothetical protein
MSNCGNLTADVLKEIDNKFADQLKAGLQNESNSKIFSALREIIKKHVTPLTYRNLTDDNIKDLMKGRSFSASRKVLSDLFTRIRESNSDLTYKESSQDESNTEKPKEEKSLKVSPVVQQGPIKSASKSESLSDIYSNFFKGTTLAYNKFKNTLGRKAFAATIVNFNVGENSGIVRSQS